MDLDKRYITQCKPVGGGFGGDDKARVWTEVRFDVTDLVEMLGLAAGTRLISLVIDREHSHMTWTFEEPREALCHVEPSSSASSDGSASA